MKKLTALLLLVALLLLGCSQAKDQLGERGRFDTAQPTSLDLENLDEQLIEELGWTDLGENLPVEYQGLPYFNF